MKKRIISILSVLLLITVTLPLLFSCNDAAEVGGNDTTQTEIKINGNPITNYTIIYAEEELNFGLNAAEYVRDGIKEATGVELEIKIDAQAEETEYEIVIGATNREISAEAAKTELGGYEFVAAAKDNKIVLYGKEYMVAGAAYNFVNTALVSGTLPEEFAPASPEYKDPENFILVIGDGMGFNSLEYGEDMYESGIYMLKEDTMMYDQYKVADRLPYKAQSHTRSADVEPVTDSAAGGTALATGYKTYNGMIGLDVNYKPLKNLSELAKEMGMMAAVLTTDVRTGATPSAFSAHSSSRDDSSELSRDQENSDIDVIIGDIRNPYPVITSTLEKIGDAENGFFMMYEEAYIDKSNHSNDAESLYEAYTRLNTALRLFSEFVMYNPDTVLILTADHETGGITWDEEKSTYKYTSGNHTGACVPFYALGKGVEHIDGNKYDNTYIAKLIAKLMGEENFGDPTIEEMTDKTGFEELSAKETIALAKLMKQSEAEYEANVTAQRQALKDAKIALRESWGLAS